MKNTTGNNIIVRSKRQVTLPKNICDKLGINSGDILELSIEGQNLIAKPHKTRSLDALKAIQSAFEKSTITEKELVESGRQARRQIVAERYGKKS